jgi:hypothetical protein
VGQGDKRRGILNSGPQLPTQSRPFNSMIKRISKRFMGMIHKVREK